MPRGGKRLGAGRKPLPDLVRKTVTLTPADLAYLASLDPKNLSNAIRLLIAAAAAK